MSEEPHEKPKLKWNKNIKMNEELHSFLMFYYPFLK